MKYTTLPGRPLEFTVSPEVAAHLERLIRMAADPSVTEDALTASAYSPESPILDAKIAPGFGMVTPAVLADPAYAVVADLLFRKTLQERGVSPDVVAAQYTVSVSEASERLGVHTSSIRQAIASGRLASWVKGGRHYLRPAAVEAFAPERRGPRPESTPVHVVRGSFHDRVLKIKADLEPSRINRPSPGLEAVDLPPGWTSAIVLTVDKPNKQRAFRIVPSASDEQLNFSPFRVWGRFRVEEKINNPTEARKAWDGFRVATS